MAPSEANSIVAGDGKSDGGRDVNDSNELYFDAAGYDGPDACANTLEMYRLMDVPSAASPCTIGEGEVCPFDFPAQPVRDIAPVGSHRSLPPAQICSIHSRSAIFQ
jgi:hypothetical protein